MWSYRSIIYLCVHAYHKSTSVPGFPTLFGRHFYRGKEEGQKESISMYVLMFSWSACCCCSISLLTSHKYQWKRLNYCRNETRVWLCKDETVRLLQVKITPSLRNGLESLLRLSRFRPSPLANPEFPHILVVNILKVFKKSALWIVPRETTLKTTETGWLHARSITLLYELTFWDTS